MKITVREIICRFQIDTCEEKGFTITIYEPRIHKKGQRFYSQILEIDQWNYLVDYPEFAKQSKKHRQLDNLAVESWNAIYNRDKTLKLSIMLEERYTKPRGVSRENN